MTPERWRQIEELCQAALDRPADERPGFLASCEDEDLRREVESLLSHSDQAEKFIEGPAVEAVARLVAGDLDVDMAGKTIGHYTVRSLLGRGGMGEVFLAEDTKLGRTVVLKFLPKALQIDVNARRRFLREARMASSIDHPNICTIYEINEDSGVDYIAMQYVEGTSLKAHVDDGSIDIEKAIDITSQLAAGLAAAHELGIVHRDLKPANIIINSKGQAKILDFGIAKPFDRLSREGDDGESSLTLAGFVIGTPAYMSPEQALGRPVDPRSDLFSLAVILYEMVAGNNPFSRSDRSAVEVMHAVAHEETRPCDEINAAIPPRLVQIIDRGLTKQPEERYQSAQEMLDDLNAIDLKTLTRAVRRPITHDALRLATGKNTRVLGILGNPRRLILAFGVLTLSAFGLWYTLKPNFGASGTDRNQITSLAVLPLKNLTGDPSNDYLSDGVTESLIASLSKVESLAVVARDSSFTFNGDDIDYGNAGKALDVQILLTGTIQKEGEILDVAARLINVADGRVFWTTEIRKSEQQIFSLQDEIARKVALKLRPQKALSESELGRHPTDNIEAYNLYLKGRFFWHLQTEEGLNKSIEYFTQAAAIDPNFAMAYSGLADAYSSLGNYFRAPNDVMPKSGFYARKALELDPKSADAHYSLAGFKFWYDRDWPGAKLEIDTTLELAPNHALAHDLLGNYFMIFGRRDEALAEVKKAVELDPLAHYSNCDLAMQFYNSGQYDQAISYSRKNLEMVNYCPYEHLWIGESLSQEKRYPESVAELNQIRTRAKDWPPALSEKGYAYALSGDRRKAQAILKELEKVSAEKFVDPLGIAFINIGLGNKDEAIIWLNKAFDAHSFYLVFLKIDPKFDSLREHPGFAKLVDRLRL